MIKKILKKKPTLESLEKLITTLAEPDKKTEPSPDDPSWLKYIALLTGTLAALAGFLVVRTAHLTNDAIFQSNQAILAQAEASDAWGEYQADSIKARIVEVQLLPSSPLSAEDRVTLTKADQDLRERQPQIKQHAADKTRDRDEHMKQSQSFVEQKDLLEYAGLAVQMGIVLASVAAMVRRQAALHVAMAVGFVGAALTAYALLGHLIGL